MPVSIFSFFLVFLIITVFCQMGKREKEGGSPLARGEGKEACMAFLSFPTGEI